MDANATFIGFISTGLDTCWGQFDGLPDHLAVGIGRVAGAVKKLAVLFGIPVVTVE